MTQFTHMKATTLDPLGFDHSPLEIKIESCLEKAPHPFIFFNHLDDLPKFFYNI